MSFPRDTYPYTNFHELNLGYFIVHFREIFSQWANLYDQMLSWKDATNEELATWKAGVEADLDQREATLRAELETWKAQTGQDIAGWEDATLAALTAWQTATQAVFEAIRVEAAGSASAAAASAGDAATAKTAAETAQAAAEAAAASVQASTAQITTNTEDIADLKTQINYTIRKYTDATLWSKGMINASNGTFNSTTSNRMRTSYLDRYVCKIEPKNGYKILIAAYDGANNDQYIGIWNGSAFANSASWHTDAVNLRLIGSETYQYRVVGGRTDDADIDFETDPFGIVFHADTDATLTVNGIAADAFQTGLEITELNRMSENMESNVRAVSDVGTFQKGSTAYILGSYNLNTGEYTESNSACVDAGKKPIELISDDITLRIADGFRVRGVILDSTKSFSSAISSWQTGTVKPNSLQNKKGYWFKPILSKSDGSTITMAEATSYGLDKLAILSPITSPVATVYDGTNTYNTGDYCLQDGKLFICKQDSVTGIWNGSYWDEVTVGQKLEDISKQADASTSAISDTMNIKHLNVLDPDTLLDHEYRLDVNDGETQIAVTAGNSKITEDILQLGPIPALYFRQTFNTAASSTSGARIVVYFYKGTEYLGYKQVWFNNDNNPSIKNGSYRMETKSGADGIRIYVNNGSVLGSQICVSLEDLAEFTPYSTAVYQINSNQLNGKLNGKTVVNFGDSIFGNAQAPNDISSEIANITGANVCNVGFGGARMSQSTSKYDPFSMCRLAYAIAHNDYSLQDNVDVEAEGLPAYYPDHLALLESLDFSAVDIVTIAYGTNDYTNGIAADNENNPTDTSTFGGALRYSLEQLWGTYPNLKIFVCTPIYRFWLDGTSFIDDSDTHEINGIKLTDYVEKVMSIANSYHIPAIDNYYDLGINRYTRNAYFSDGEDIHPNLNGKKLMGRHIANELF